MYAKGPLCASAALVVAACSCSETPADPSSTSSSPAGGAQSSTSGLAGTGASGTGASSSSGTGGGVGGSAPTAWLDVPWPHPCETPVRYSTDPGSDVPRLNWIACKDGVTGCEEWEIHWDSPGLPGHVLLGVNPTQMGYEYGILAQWNISEQRGAYFGEAGGEALAAWRPPSGCHLVGPIPTKTGLWVGAQRVGMSSSYGFSARGALSSFEPAGTGMLSQGAPTASDNLLILQSFGAGATGIWDRVSGQMHTHSAVGDIANGTPIEDGAVVFPIYYTTGAAEGWIWQRATGSFSALHAPAQKAVIDIRGDASQLVWIEADIPAPTDTNWSPGKLYVSPYATTPGALQPAFLRDVPAYSNTAAMSEGYYAMLATDNSIHVYRLSDGRHWTFAPGYQAGTVFEIRFVDAQYVFYNTSAGVYRQPISALGPGD